MEGDDLPVRDGHLHEAEELGEEAREDEREERVRPEREERGEGALHAENVDDDEGGEQRETGRARREEDVGTGPEPLVEGKAEGLPREAAGDAGHPGEAESGEARLQRRLRREEEARERPRQHRGEGGERREDPLRVPRRLPEVSLQEGEVEGRLEISLERQVVAGKEEKRGVEGQEEDDGSGEKGDLPPHGSGEEEERAEGIDEADARQDARDPEVEEALESEREGGERPADEDDRRPPAEGVTGQLATGGPLRGALSERKDRRRPDDEEKEREDEVGRRAAVPFRVAEGREDVAQLPGLLTKSMAATVAPRKRSRAASRLAGGRAAVSEEAKRRF